MSLTEEQKRLIEENKRRALEKLAARNQPTALPTPHLTPAVPAVPAVVDTAQFITFTPIAAGKPLSFGNAPPAPVAQQPLKQPQAMKQQPVKLEIESAGFFSCPHLPHLYDQIKALPGAVFNHQQSLVTGKSGKKESYWSIPIEQHYALMQLLPTGEKPKGSDQIPESVLKLFLNKTDIARKRSTNGFDLNLLEPTIASSLFPFQKDGIQMALARSGRIILADDMGLGKSIQSLGIASYYRREWPLLIISPASMVSTWHEQVKRWLPSVNPNDICVLYDSKSSLNGLVNIGSFDLLTRVSDMVSSKNFKMIIVDESHALKNADSKRSKALIPIITKASRAILLSGTPALSRPIELFSQIKAVSPKLFTNYFDFGRRYCAGRQTTFGWDMRGSSNAQELQVILENTIMIRRTKAEVLTQLPPKTREQIFVKVHQKDLKMFAAMNSKVAHIDDLSAMEQRGELMDMWRKTGEAKAPAMLEYIEDILEAGHKILVFAHHKYLLDYFEDAFMKGKRKYIRIDGSTNTQSRQEICTQFQTDPSVRVALLSITAANTGLTLTAATTVLFAELYWNPGHMIQAEDRAHRIGQCDSVNVQYLLAKGTADDTLWPLILKKLNTLESVGLGKNDFKGIDRREHDPDQLTLEKAWKKPRLEFQNDNDHDVVTIE